MSNKEQNIIYYKTQSKTSKLKEIRAFVKRNASVTKLDSDSTDNLVLAVDEACTNLIKHAYKNDYDNEINISFEIYDTCIQVRITDFATPFDLRNVKNPDLTSHYKNFNKNGLGIYIIKSLVDSIDYKVSNNGTKKNILILKKNLPR